MVDLAEEWHAFAALVLDLALDNIHDRDDDYGFDPVSLSELVLTARRAAINRSRQLGQCLAKRHQGAHAEHVVQVDLHRALIVEKRADLTHESVHHAAFISRPTIVLSVLLALLLLPVTLELVKDGVLGDRDVRIGLHLGLVEAEISISVPLRRRINWDTLLVQSEGGVGV